MNIENILCKINEQTKNRLFSISEAISNSEVISKTKKEYSLLTEVNNRFIGKLYGTLETLFEINIITNEEYIELFEYFMFLYNKEDR